MSPLRDLLIVPRPAEQDALPGAAPAASLAVLAPARDLSAVAIAAGLALARGRSAAVVCVHATGALSSVRSPARAGAGRLAASLTARGLVAEARGPLAVVWLPDDPEELSTDAARALAAAGPLPTLLAVARRSEAVDGLLAACDAILVALPPAAEPPLAGLALASAMELVPSAAAIELALDPIRRSLALAGVWSPRAIRRAIQEVVT
jgi:hypothetical protein